MHLSGTGEGVFKVGTIRARPDGENWSQDAVRALVGSPAQPQPGVGGRRIITFAKKKGEDKKSDQGGLQPPTDAPPEPRNVRITKQDIDRHGPTPGCQGCQAIIGNKLWRSVHTIDCRIRMEKAMMGDEEIRSRVEKANNRIVNRIVDNSAVPEDENSKRKGRGLKTKKRKTASRQQHQWRQTTE